MKSTCSVIILISSLADYLAYSFAFLLFLSTLKLLLNPSIISIQRVSFTFKSATKSSKKQRGKKYDKPLSFISQCIINRRLYMFNMKL